MLPTLQIGPLALQVPGLVLIAGLWLGLTLSERRARRHGKNVNYLYNLVFIAIIAGVVGARISYAITYPGAFASNPWSLISINPGLLDPFAGFLFAAAATLIYLCRNQLPVWTTLDDLTPLFAILAIAQGIAHLASGNAFGAPTDLPWSIYIWGASRHPTQIYEILLATLILLAIILLDRVPWFRTSGVLFLSFTAITAASRLFLEAFRGDSTIIGDRFRLPQVIAWLVLAVCLTLIGRRIQLTSSVENGIS